MKKIGTCLSLAIALASLSAACTISGKDEGAPAPAGGSENAPPGTPAATPAPGASNDPTAPAPTPSPGKAIVRVVHGSPDAPAVDVYVKGNDMPIVTGLAYGQTSTWLEVPPASYEFELRASPSKPTDPIAYKTSALTIPEGAKITAIAAGLLGSNDADSAFRVLPIVESWAAATPETARVRVIHAGSDAPTVGIDVGNDDPSKPEVPSLARFADTGGDGISLPAETALWVGVDAGGDRVTSFTTPKLPGGADVMVIATGLLGKLGRETAGFALLAVGPNGSLGFIKQDPVVYALHASPDAPTVDAYAGEAEILDGISFGNLRGPFQLQPGTYALDFYAHGTNGTRPAGAPAASGSTGALAAGERYLTIATGFLANKSFELESYRDGFSLDQSKPQLRAVHSSPDAPMVDIGVASSTLIDPILFGGLSFGMSSSEGGLAASAGTYPVGVAPAGQDGTIVAKFTVPAATDQRAFVIAAGALDPKKGQPFRLAVVDTTPWPWSVTHIFH
ncbi:MAG TPA: DUF4397 domain-containing protein [Labilithrix sp.]|jgi:hypothetical protein